MSQIPHIRIYMYIHVHICTLQYIFAASIRKSRILRCFAKENPESVPVRRLDEL